MIDLSHKMFSTVTDTTGQRPMQMHYFHSMFLPQREKLFPSPDTDYSYC
jgi:hypothetical protein